MAVAAQLLGPNLFEHNPFPKEGPGHESHKQAETPSRIPNS